MHETWREHPPTDWLAAAYLKYKPPLGWGTSRWRSAVENTRGVLHRLIGPKRNA